MVKPLSSVVEDTDRKTSRRRRRSQLGKPSRWLGWTGMKAQRRMKTTASLERLELYQKYMDLSTWPKEKPTNLRH